jgi:hypothetical protein
MRQLGSIGRHEPLHRSQDFFEANRRHLEPGWYEWALREFARYFYVLGILAVLVLVPLQLMAWWMPPRAPAVIDSGLGVSLVVGFVAGVLYFGLRGYSYFWRVGGYVDRTMAERAVQASSAPKSPPRL